MRKPKEVIEYSDAVLKYALRGIRPDHIRVVVIRSGGKKMVLNANDQNHLRVIRDQYGHNLDIRWIHHRHIAAVSA